MEKKKKHKKMEQPSARNERKDEGATLKDQLSDSVFEKLQAAKRQLKEQEVEREQEEAARRAFEKKQREKNMTFEELLNQYGDKGSKF